MHATLDVSREEYQGIPMHLRYSNLDLELASHEEARQAVDLVGSCGWKNALERVFGAGSPEVCYAADPRRFLFADLLPLTPETDALEIGVGFGQHTVGLARRVRSLDVIEVRLLNTIFTRSRCEQEGVDNVNFYCGGDDCVLPFVDNSYDLVVMNLVLEWCASGNRHAPGVQGQQRMLSEVRRVLRPGGILQVNTKNRYALSYVLGGPDEHLHNLRFGSALPRFLQRALLKRRGLRPVGHLHSYRGLRSLIESQGMRVVRTFEAYPEMRFPKHFLDSSRSWTIPRGVALGPTRRTRMVMRMIPAPLRKHFTAGLFFLAEKVDH